MISSGILVFFLMTIAAILGFLIAWFFKREVEQQLQENYQQLQVKLTETKDKHTVLVEKQLSLAKSWEEKNSSLITKLSTADATIITCKTELVQQKAAYQNLLKQSKKNEVQIANATSDIAQWKEKYQSLMNSHKKLVPEVEQLRNQKLVLEKSLKENKLTTTITTQNKTSTHKADTEARRKAILNRIAAKKNRFNTEKLVPLVNTQKDNLKSLKGLGSFVEAKLNAIGIVNLKQLAALDTADQLLLNELLELPKNKFQKEEWVLQSKVILGLVGQEDDSQEILKRIKLRRKQLNFDKIGFSLDDTKDDLTQIKHITPFDHEKLIALGINSFSQIAALDVEDVAFVNGALEIENGRITNEDWVEQARHICTKRKKHMLNQIREQRDAIDWIRIGKTLSRKKDNLQSIDGINNTIEEKLNMLGIQQFEQLSKFVTEDIHTIAQIIDISPQQIIEEAWIEKAKRKK